MTSRLTAIALVTLCLGALGFAVFLIVDIGSVSISIHGYIAMGLGLVLSLVLGIGLMKLAYYSHKQGFDDDAHAGVDDLKDDPS